MLRTQEPETTALKALGLSPGSKTPWLLQAGMTTVMADGGPAVYSVSLWDESYRQSTLTRPKP